MEIKTVLFVLVLGWIAGSEGVPPSLVDWFTARETIGRHVEPANCQFDGAPFQLRQVVVSDQGLPPVEPH